MEARSCGYLPRLGPEGVRESPPSQICAFRAGGRSSRSWLFHGGKAAFSAHVTGKNSAKMKSQAPNYPPAANPATTPPLQAGDHRRRFADGVRSRSRGHESSTSVRRNRPAEPGALFRRPGGARRFQERSCSVAQGREVMGRPDYRAALDAAMALRSHSGPPRRRASEFHRSRVFRLSRESPNPPTDQRRVPATHLR